MLIRRPHVLGAVCAAAVLLAACKTTQRSSSGVLGLDVENSNIAADLGVAGKPITSMKLLSNTMVPKGFIVSLTGVNKEFIRTLYKIVAGINKTETLSGLEGYKQEVTMVVVGKGRDLWDELVVDLGGGKPPYLQYIEGVSDGDLWMQDWGEFAKIKVEGSDKEFYAVMDTGRGREITAEDLSKVFKIPFVPVSDTRSGAPSGNYGGNTEATHEGRLYYGDHLTDTTMRERLETLGNDAIEIQSAWLRVGHVDEYTTFIPSNKACGASLVIASPIEGLSLLAGEKDADLDSYGFPFDAAAYRAALADALVDPTKPAPWTVDDFKDDIDPTTEALTYIKHNLRYEGIAVDARKKLLDGSTCKPDVVTVPQVFSTTTKAIATLGGTTNMLVLRDHLIIPEPYVTNAYPAVKSFRAVIKKKLGERVGGEAKVHFIDTTPYHTRSGEIHCGTNVVREMTMPFKIPAP